MKSKRQQKITDIIKNVGVETQDELISHLRDAGYDVTQATVSRDIREMKITKAQGTDGRYTYILPDDGKNDGTAVYGVTISHSLKSAACAGNIVVLKTYPGLADAVAAGVDSQKSDEVLGCVAGDDTIIVVTKSEEAAKNFSRQMEKSAGI